MNIENNIKKTSYNYIPPHTTMPKHCIDYSNTVFYKIVCRNITIKELYVGHTTDFKARKARHKSVCNKVTGAGYNLKVYKFIRENGGWVNWDMIIIHRQGCIDLNDAKTIERGFIETLNSDLNFYIPCRTAKEFRDVNAVENNERSALWYAINSDRVKARNIMNKDHIREVQLKYREVNKEKLQANQKISNEARKDKRRENAKMSIEVNKDKITLTKKVRIELTKDEKNEKQRKYRANKKLLKQTLDEII